MFSHFIYDGIPSDYYDVVACWVGNKLSGVESAGMKTDISTQFAKRGNSFNIVQQSYDKPIEFKVQLINKDATHIDTVKERDLKKWLCKRGEYRWMQILRDDYEDLYFLANFSNPKYIYHGGVCGLEFEVTTSSPYMFSPLIKKRFNITDDNDSVNLYIENDEDDYVYPTVKIKMNQGGALTIRNSSEIDHRYFSIENVSTGEVIYADSLLPDISSVLPSAYSGDDGIAMASEDMGIAVASDEGIATTATTITKKYLYKRGDECTSVTGGWAVLKEDETLAGTISKNSNYISLSTPTLASGSYLNKLYVYTNNEFNYDYVSKFDRICYTYSYVGQDQFSSLRALYPDGTWYPLSVSFPSGSSISTETTNSTSQYSAFQNVSSCNIGFELVQSPNYQNELRIHEIWLESDEPIEDPDDDNSSSGDNSGSGDSSGDDSGGNPTPPNIGSDDENTTYLYNYGTTASIVGGWSLYDSEDDSSYGGEYATVKENSNHLYFNIIANNDNNSQHLDIITNNMLDFSQYTRIGIRYDYSGVSNSSNIGTAPITFAMKTEKSPYGSANVFPFFVSGGENNAVQYLDLQDIHQNGFKYFSIKLSENSNADDPPVTGNMTFRIYQIWLEKGSDSGDSGGEGDGGDDNIEDWNPDENGRKLLYNYGVTSPLVGSWSIYNKNTSGIAEERNDHLYFHTDYDSGNFIDTYACMITNNKLNMSQYAKVGIRYDYNGVSNIAYTGIQPIMIATRTENSPTSESDIMPFFAYGDEVNKIQRVTLYGHENENKHLSFMIKTDNVTAPITDMPLTLKIYQIWLEVAEELDDDNDDGGDSGDEPSWEFPFDPTVPINYNPNIYHNFNKNWLRFVDGRNTLTFSLNCEVEIEYREIRKVGVMS